MELNLSRKYKLPKRFWIKGRSKFLYPRLLEEGIAFGDNAWTGDLYYTPIQRLYDKLEGRKWQGKSLMEILKEKGVKKDGILSKIKRAVKGK